MSMHAILTLELGLDKKIILYHVIITLDLEALKFGVLGDLCWHLLMGSTCDRS